jgi:hypothetical protein
MTKKTLPTPEQIAAEIAALKDLAPRVRRFNFFNEDNREAIETQIVVLERRYSEDSVYEYYGDDTKEEFSQRELDVALDAAHWLSGETSEAPSEGWKELVQGE